jgi:hypothetical protein
MAIYTQRMVIHGTKFSDTTVMTGNSLKTDTKYNYPTDLDDILENEVASIYEDVENSGGEVKSLTITPVIGEFKDIIEDKYHYKEFAFIAPYQYIVVWVTDDKAKNTQE